MPQEQPFRDERAAALARVDDLQRELARTRAELAATKRQLARRQPWTDLALRGTMALATILVVLMGLAMLFAGCAGCAARMSTATIQKDQPSPLVIARSPSAAPST